MDHNPGFFQLSAAAHAILGPVFQLKYFFGNFIQRPAGRREGDLLSRAEDQFDFIKILKPLNTLGYRGLRNTQTGRGRAEAAVFYRRIKKFQLVKVHCQTPCSRFLDRSAVRHPLFPAARGFFGLQACFYQISTRQQLPYIGPRVTTEVLFSGKRQKGFDFLSPARY